MVMDTTATQPGLEWRRFYAEQLIDDPSAPAPLEPADEHELSQRRAKAQPATVQTAQDRRDWFIEHIIHPWAHGVCLRAMAVREARKFDDYADMLTARAECNPYMEDEQARLADAWLLEHENAQHQFTIVRQQLEALNAREPDSSQPTAEYVEIELRLLELTGFWGLKLTGGQLAGLLLEVECDLEAYEIALRKHRP